MGSGLGRRRFLAVSIWLYLIRKRWPALLASWICYFMLLWLIPDNRSLALEMLADHRAYLSCIPWAVLTRCCRDRLLAGFCVNGRIRPWLLFVGVGASAMILFGLGVLTSAQTRVWHDSETLWKNAAAGSGTKC